MGLFAKVAARIGGRKPVETDGGGGYSVDWCMSTSDGVRHELDNRSCWYSNAYLACELAKARPLGTLPVGVYRRTRSGREELPDHPLSRLLNGRWNPFVTSSEGLRWLVMTRDTLGAAYVRVEYGPDGSPTALWPLKGKVTPEWVARTRRAYWNVEEGDTFTRPGTYQPWEVLCVKSPVALDRGIEGKSLAALSAANIGLSVDLERFYERLISNGNHFPGYLQTDQKLEQGDIDRLASDLRGTSGVMEAGRVRVFDKGLTYHSVGMTMADMSLIEQQTWVLQQTCRVLSVPPQEVYDLSHATYSNVEQGAIQFVQKTLLPEVHDIENALNCLLDAMGERGRYVKFDMSGLMRGDYASRMEGYRTGAYAGFFTRNDIRRWEDLPALPGLDAPLLPTAYVPIGEDGAPVQAVEQRSAAPVDPQGGDPIVEDMRRRVRERFASNGVSPKTRAFAESVFGPYAMACALAGIEFDMEAEVEACATSTCTER
ncbi:phage portal protein [Gordonibacter urolithinfaciens]|uniref:phage portal protein n=1 Tax=Gordonibacter urolithinfaciens TaxID=1335613 RepID=UPI003A8D539A